MQPLLDRFGRVATDLRLSLTDRCNLRCAYCMPAEGLPFLPREQTMSRREIARLVGVAVRDLGVTEIRLTGGEPLLRADLVDIVADLAALDPRPGLALTTNAVGLASRAAALREAGLDRLNVSLDSLHADTFAQLTRRDFLGKVMAGIDAAKAAGFASVKVNAVLLRGVNDDQAVELLDWALAEGHQLRFIEQMPLDADRAWERAGLVTAAEVRERLAEAYTLVPSEEPRGGAPAQLWRVLREEDGRLVECGTVGTIASVTENFCAACTRTRLTAEGKVMSCLFSREETDLLGPLRAGASDDELAGLWRDAMRAKPAGHGLDAESLEAGAFVPVARTMNAIGG